MGVPVAVTASVSFDLAASGACVVAAGARSGLHVVGSPAGPLDVRIECLAYTAGPPTDDVTLRVSQDGGATWGDAVVVQWATGGALREQLVLDAFGAPVLRVVPGPSDHAELTLTPGAITGPALRVPRQVYVAGDAWTFVLARRVGRPSVTEGAVTLAVDAVDPWAADAFSHALAAGLSVTAAGAFQALAKGWAIGSAPGYSPPLTPALVPLPDPLVPAVATVRERLVAGMAAGADAILARAR